MAEGRSGKGSLPDILVILRVLLGLLFISSSILKISDLILFEESIVMFNIFPEYSKLFALIIPALEFTGGASLVIGIFRKAAIVILIPLMLSFTIAIGINLRAGNIFDCGCFGPLDVFSKISTGKILFNIALIIGLGFVFIMDKENGDKKKFVNILNHLKVIMTIVFVIAMLLYIPFSNVSWAFTVHKKNINEINWETATMLLQEDHAFLFDTRASDRFDKEHVPGALSLPFLEFNKYIKKYNMPDKNSMVIVYCDGKECSSALRTCLKFIARGYRNVFKVNGGFDAWHAYN